MHVTVLWPLYVTVGIFGTSDTQKVVSCVFVTYMFTHKGYIYTLEKKLWS